MIRHQTTLPADPSLQHLSRCKYWYHSVDNQRNPLGVQSTTIVSDEFLNVSKIEVRIPLRADITQKIATSIALRKFALFPYIWLPIDALLQYHNGLNPSSDAHPNKHQAIGSDKSGNRITGQTRAGRVRFARGQLPDTRRIHSARVQPTT
eukprot:scaffold3697_cov390-Prasinococcus_capsulatus_cf.AAC.11